jgi:hypothetical protein
MPTRAFQRRERDNEGLDATMNCAELDAGRRRARRTGGWVMTAALLAAGVALAPGPARAALYKWVDDKGVVHYSDQVPADAVNKGNVQLNRQGIPIKKVEPAITPEQRRAQEAQVERQKEAAKQEEETARRDRALLDSYTSESDIDLAKARAVETIQAAVRSAQAYSAQLTKRKAALLERQASLAGKKTSPELARDIESVDAELARQSDYIAQKNRQLVEVTARYDADKARWKAISSRSAANAPAAQGTASAPGSSPPSTARK